MPKEKAVGNNYPHPRLTSGAPKRAYALKPLVREPGNGGSGTGFFKEGVMDTRPDDYEMVDWTPMSNFDHEIEYGAEDRLRGEKVIATYPAWNFNAKVWFDGVFKAEVWCYGSHVQTICADSLRDIMDKASSVYGDD